MTGNEVEVGDSWAVDRLNKCERNIPNVNKKCSSMGKRQALQVQLCQHSNSIDNFLIKYGIFRKGVSYFNQSEARKQCYFPLLIG